MITKESYNSFKDRDFLDSLPKISTSYDRSKAQVWAVLEEKIDFDKQPTNSKGFKLPLKRIASIAAIFAVIASVAAAVIFTNITENDEKYEEVSVVENVKNRRMEIKNGLFIFTASPLDYTFSEISKEYKVTINYKLVKKLNKIEGSEDRLYTGRFKRSLEVEQVLNVVCRSMKLNYKKIDDKKYIIEP
ncbi:MAG: DUF4974 domain-containing protein [Rikenellaceae bacterium]